MLFVLYLLPRLSVVSVVFDFNPSLNDVAPDSLMLESFLLHVKLKQLIVDGIHLCAISFVFTFQIKLSKCCV